MALLLLLQLLQGIIGMVDECKSAVKSLRQHCQLTTLRSVDLHADINQRAGLYVLVNVCHSGQYVLSYGPLRSRRQLLASSCTVR